MGHGEDHEGPGPQRHLDHGLHVCQEALGNQPRPQRHPRPERQGQRQQERLLRQGPCPLAVRNCPPLLWLHPRGPCHPRQPNPPGSSWVWASTKTTPPPRLMPTTLTRCPHLRVMTKTPQGWKRSIKMPLIPPSMKNSLVIIFSTTD